MQASTRSGVMKSPFIVNDTGSFLITSVVVKDVRILNSYFIRIVNAGSVSLKRISLESVVAINGTMISVQSNSFSASEMCFDNGHADSALHSIAETCSYQSIACTHLTNMHDIILTLMSTNSDNPCTERATNCSDNDSPKYVPGHVVYFNSGGNDHKFYNIIRSTADPTKGIIYFVKQTGVVSAESSLDFCNIINSNAGWLLILGGKAILSNVVVTGFTGSIRTNAPDDVVCTNCHADKPSAISGFSVEAAPQTVIMEGTNNCPTYVFSNVRSSPKKIMILFYIIDL